MIHVYYGGADKEKDRFLFDSIRERLPADIVLLVPDQFTLQAERNAFEYLNTDTLLQLEVMSRSGYIRRIMSQQGEPGGIAVNKYGRYMLLTRLMLAEEKHDGIFAAVNRKSSFITMLNDLISEMKQYGIRPEDLSDVLNESDWTEDSNETVNDGRTAPKTGIDDEVLSSKIRDIQSLFIKYEEHISGKYTDTEDYQRIAAEKIYESAYTARTEFWVDGFDYMTPVMLMQLEAIACTAPNLSIILTGDDSVDDAFAVSQHMRRKLREIAEKNGIRYSETAIPNDYLQIMKPEVSILQASDFYAEAESIAIDILKLVREKAYRYRDIVIICNDAQKRGSVFRRIFDNYGIPLFIDRKRGISQEPAVEFIFSMLDVVQKGRLFNDVFRMLKTGYSPLSDDECEELENYCRKYNIRSGRWKNDFIYGLRDEGEEKLIRLNDMRARTDEFITEAEQLFKGKNTVRDRVEALYRFLADTVRLPEQLENDRVILEEQNRLEEAESASQIWSTVISVADQMVEVAGDYELPHQEFVQILKEGFSEVEIGLIPTNNDQVLFGTMQRTRTGKVKALFVAGVNEGVLPESGRSEGILSDEEKQIISEKWKQISKTDELRDMEQSLAMYKNLSKAEEYMCISYANMDTEGAELRPSQLVADIMQRNPNAVIRGDYMAEGDASQLIQTKRSALPHVAKHLRSSMGGNAEDIWKAAALLLDGFEQYETVKKGLLYKNKVENIERDTVRRLYGRGSSRELILSTSGIEKYSRCPFSFFVAYGLRPEEERSFEVDMRSIGEVYHECLRRVAAELSSDGIEIWAPESAWNRVSQAECRKMTDLYVKEFADRYREGVFNLAGREKYVQKRIREVCFQTAWLMISQVRSGRVKAVYFEQRFARRSDALFPPVEIRLEDGGSVFIEGIIDRVDIIPGYTDSGEQRDFVRIIDYKSGSEAFDLSEVRSGWRLQLMIYLKGAMGAMAESRPAGVFYFAIKDTAVDVTDISEAEVDGVVADEIKKSSRLDGILVDRDDIIEGMDENIEAKSSSEVIPVRRKADGSYTGSSLLSEEEFDELIAENDSNITLSAAKFAMGCVDIDPKSGKNTEACRYCNFRSICNKE